MKLFIERAPLIETLGSLGLNEALREAETRPSARVHRPRHRRSFNSAKITRLNRDFPWTWQSQRPHIYRSLRILRARSRELARNNDWFIKFLRMCRRNVIGPNGMRIQSQAKTKRGNKFDEKLNTMIEEHWKIWSHPENASGNGCLSWHDIQLKLITMLARDGEILIRKIPANNPYGYALKVLDPAWLDERWNQKEPNGNRIINSVELDNDDRPVAYWLTPPPDEYYAQIQPLIRQRTRVPADQIYHDFIPFEQNCGDDTVTRGIPWAHAAMVKLWDIGAFDESAIIAARIGASKMGFFKNRAGDPLALTPQELEAAAGGKSPDARVDDDDDDNELFDHVEPGQFGDIGDKDFQEFNPHYPDAMVEPFERAMLRGVAASLGTEYFTLTSDLTQVNFSAGRLGVDEERDAWRVIQAWAKEHLVRRVHMDWQRSGMLTGILPIGPDELARLSEPKITARGFGYYDPLKDVEGTVMAIDNGLDTRTDTLSEQGKDFDEVVATLAIEKQAADAAGIIFVGGKPTPGLAPENKPADPNDPNAG